MAEDDDARLFARWLELARACHQGAAGPMPPEFVELCRIAEAVLKRSYDYGPPRGGIAYFQHHHHPDPAKWWAISSLGYRRSHLGEAIQAVAAIQAVVGLPAEKRAGSKGGRPRKNVDRNAKAVEAIKAGDRKHWQIRKDLSLTRDQLKGIIRQAKKDGDLPPTEPHQARKPKPEAKGSE